jgi:diadenosine tetraphosphatase ApaH/serine/threonine PP2A family protein phosphatase
LRLLILSDVHANLEALEACLAVAPAHDSVTNLGDVVGYNASPNEVVERIREMNCPVVRGNHDRACSGLSNLSEFNLVAALSARWTQLTLQPENQDWLRSLPEGPLLREEFPGVEFVHGSPRHEDEYVLNVPTASLDFHLPGHSDVIFFGHTHLQGGFSFDVKEGKTRAFAPKYPNEDQVVKAELLLEPGQRYLINPGSVGQPRDNDWRAAFALFETSEDAPATVTFYRVPYDVEKTQARIISSRLPERLATRLALGR